MKLELSLSVETENPGLLKNALKPELEDVNSKRSQVNYSIKQNTFTITINADDINALRASINSHLLWLKTFEKVITYGNTP